MKFLNALIYDLILPYKLFVTLSSWQFSEYNNVGRFSCCLKPVIYFMIEKDLFRYSRRFSSAYSSNEKQKVIRDVK